MREFKCQDCTTEEIDCPQIRKELWRALSLGPKVLLCLECFEKRLERKITRDDFADCLWTRATFKLLNRAKVGDL